MKKWIHDFFLRNHLLKLLAALLAVLLWLVLSNVQDPLVDSTVVCPIIYDDSGLAGRNLTVTSKPNSVTIPVTVRKSRLRNLSSEDFTVTCNLLEVIGDLKESPDSSKVCIEISRIPGAGYIQSWQYPQSQNYVKVVFDQLKTMTYPARPVILLYD